MPNTWQQAMIERTGAATWQQALMIMGLAGYVVTPDSPGGIQAAVTAASAVYVATGIEQLVTYAPGVPVTYTPAAGVTVLPMSAGDMPLEPVYVPYTVPTVAVEMHDGYKSWLIPDHVFAMNNAAGVHTHLCAFDFARLNGIPITVAIVEDMFALDADRYWSPADILYGLQGGAEIACHSYSHDYAVDYRTKTYAQVIRETIGAKAYLEALTSGTTALGIKCRGYMEPGNQTHTAAEFTDWVAAIIKQNFEYWMSGYALTGQGRHAMWSNATPETYATKYTQAQNEPVVVQCHGMSDIALANGKFDPAGGSNHTKAAVRALFDRIITLRDAGKCQPVTLSTWFAARPQQATTWGIRNGSLEDMTALVTAEGINGRSAAVTFTDAGDLVTHPNHGFATADPVVFSNIGTVVGLAINTTYYVIKQTGSDTYKLADTAEHAAALTALTFTTTGATSTGLVVPDWTLATVEAETGHGTKVVTMTGPATGRYLYVPAVPTTPGRHWCFDFDVKVDGTAAALILGIGKWDGVGVGYKTNWDLSVDGALNYRELPNGTWEKVQALFYVPKDDVDKFRDFTVTRAGTIRDLTFDNFRCYQV